MNSNPMDTATTFDDFQAAALAAGFDEVLVREWAAGQVVGEHTHPFVAQARVVRGSLSLRCGGFTSHIPAGGGFLLERDLPHQEQYGPDGATLWVARRSAAA